MTTVSSLLTRKREIEAGFFDAGDSAGQHEYLAVLRKLDRECCGILDFRWPGVAAPLYMRCGSSDISNFTQMFIAKEYGFELDFAPARILDLGAYAGYAAAYLAHRFPHAEIVSIEPSAANFQMLTLNTGAYSRIRRLNVAVWGHSANLNIASTAGGDWGLRLAESEICGAGLPALSIPDIMTRMEWDTVDYLKCDIEGAEVSVFGKAGALIAGMVQCCTVETHDAIAPGSSRIVKDAFPAADFINTRNGEFEVFVRRNAIRAGSGAVAPVSILRPALGIRPIDLTNVREEGWAYYMFDADSCQLHPANRGEPHAELATIVALNGHKKFVCEVSVENALGYNVDFIVDISSCASDRVIASANLTVAAVTKQRLSVLLDEPAYGSHRVALRTIMAKDSPSNHQAFANWHRPTLC